MTAEEAKEAVKFYGGQRAAARALGIHPKTLWKAMRSTGAAPGRPKSAAGATPAAKVRSLAEFRQSYDKDTIVPARVKEGLAKLGKDGWLYEVEFARLAGVSMIELGAYRDKFSEFVVSMRDRRAWAGSKKTANEMRRML